MKSVRNLGLENEAAAEGCAGSFAGSFAASYDVGLCASPSSTSSFVGAAALVPAVGPAAPFMQGRIPCLDLSDLDEPTPSCLEFQSGRLLLLPSEF